MVIHVKVVFVGLCTLLNFEAAPNLSDPAMVAPLAMDHEAFIAYKDSEVSSSAASLDHHGGYSKLEVTNEAIGLSDDVSGTPVIDSAFKDDLAHFSTFSNLTPPLQYDSRYVPAPGNEPDAALIAAYCKVGGGSVTAGNPTKITWDFRNAANSAITNPNVSARKFARSVTYTYDLPANVNKLTVSLKRLGANTTRTVVFQPQGGGDTITIYVGNAVNWYDDITFFNPAHHGFPANHFRAFYKFVTNNHTLCTVPGHYGTVEHSRESRRRILRPRRPSLIHAARTSLSVLRHAHCREVIGRGSRSIRPHRSSSTATKGTRDAGEYEVDVRTPESVSRAARIEVRARYADRVGRSRRGPPRVEIRRQGRSADACDEARSGILRRAT
jgi:hypothetical protein